MRTFTSEQWALLPAFIMAGSGLFMALMGAGAVRYDATRGLIGVVFGMAMLVAGFVMMAGRP